MNILLVDDEPEILNILEDYFLEHFARCSFTQASDGALALHLCWTQTFDLICTDYSMPIMNGLEFVERLRSQEGPNRTTPIIFLSGYLPEFRDQAETIENVYLLEKPLVEQTLVRISSLATQQPLIRRAK